MVIKTTGTMRLQLETPVAMVTRDVISVFDDDDDDDGHLGNQQCNPFEADLRPLNLLERSFKQSGEMALNCQYGNARTSTPLRGGSWLRRVSW